MTDILYRCELHSPEQARQVLKERALPWIGEQLAQGRELVLEARLLDDARTIQQLRFLWGVVYKETSEQARIEGVQYTPDAWHELGKRLHLPREHKKTRVAGRKRAVVVTTIGSTKGKSVKFMSKYIEKFMAWATTDFGVAFSEPLPPELRGARARAKAIENNAVDPDTGEITFPPRRERELETQS